MDYSTDLTRKRNLPLRPNDYPDEETFNKGVAGLRKLDPKIFDDVSPRGGKTMEEYLYGVGMVMAFVISPMRRYVCPHVDNDRFRVLSEPQTSGDFHRLKQKLPPRRMSRSQLQRRNRPLNLNPLLKRIRLFHQKKIAMNHKPRPKFWNKHLMV